ncbi:MAG: hypothetical protein D5R98_00785 [Desulfonatronovibrio sp. MSAO_Bac4]|nr:MAG: hypothetical protein D5R98_00785 [Desulfonatronovibrio sp. MSAO_Bac4]
MIVSKDLEKRLIDDNDLEKSYSITGDLNRSWMKKQIACLFNIYNHNAGFESTSIQHMRAGIQQYQAQAPFQSLLVFVNNSFRAWNRLLALTVPAVTSGIKDIGVFFVRDNQAEPYPQILTALELAGIENIYVITQDQLKSLPVTSDMFQNSIIADICPENISHFPGISLSGNFKYTRCFHKSSFEGLVWAESEYDWNLEIIQEAHPDVSFTIAGPETPIDVPGLTVSKKDFSTLTKKHWDLFLGPENLYTQTNIPLGLSPGMEALWLWPHIDNHFFKTRQTYCKEI